MTMRTFIQSHRDELDAAIRSVIYRYDGNGGRGRVPDDPPAINDKERMEWILNDEGLYRWARAEGVRI